MKEKPGLGSEVPTPARHVRVWPRQAAPLSEFGILQLLEIR